MVNWTKRMGRVVWFWRTHDFGDERAGDGGKWGDVKKKTKMTKKRQ
jgi:hypothetical protein